MPTRKDNTNVAPIHREQVFIPFKGAKKIMWDSIPKANGRRIASGAIDIVSPEFDLLTGIRGLANMVKPKTYKSIINNGDFNPIISEIDNAVNQGIQMGRDYINNPIVQSTLEHNRQLYKRLFGKPQNMIYINKHGEKVLANNRGELLSNAVSYPIQYKFGKLPKKVSGEYNRSKDMTGNITLAENLSPSITKHSAFHETLHHGAYGNYDGIIYDLKAEKLFPNNAYLRAGHEAAANTAEVGRDMGLALGQKYPGRQVFRDMLDNLLAKPYYKDFVIKDAKLDTNRDYKRLWDALTGKYFTTAGAAATGLSLTNNNKMKCGGRRKGEFGLDIQYGGRAIPIGRNMVYFDGNSHENGGIGVGNNVEVEGGEVGEYKDNTLRVFSSVPFLRGVSPAQLVMGGANPDAVFKAQETFKDRNRINDDGTRYKAGGIYIKPSKRGTFTAAAIKRGMGVQEFANKVLANREDYSPAMVKKANFARNASHWKKEYGGSMIYTINGNVKNGLMSARAKAEFGKDVKYPYADGNRRYYINNGAKIYSDGQIVDEKGYNKYYVLRDKNRNFLGYSTDENGNRELAPVFNEKIAKEAYEYSKNKRPQYYVKKELPLFGSQSIAEKAGLARSGWSYGDSPTFDYIPKIDISVPTNYAKAVGDNAKINTSSTPRGRGTKSSKATASTKPATVEAKQPKLVERPKENLYITGIKNNAVKSPFMIGMEKISANPASSSTGGGTQSKDGRWVPQYNLITGIDWAGVGTNLAGHIASYFANRDILDKYPMPTKPVMAPAVKLKTRVNINPDLTNSKEAELMGIEATNRNTSSSNTSLARNQRIMNEGRDARNKLYAYKENAETQLINQDNLNRQGVYARNVAAYNDWLNKTYVAKTNKLLAKQQNLMNLINGIPMAVNNVLGNIETRKSTNDMIHAIAAANPNVDGRLLGIGDYYTQQLGNGKIAKYNKNHKFIKYV